MGKGKKNKAKHAARKAAEKAKYVTIEDVYEPRRDVGATADAFAKTEEPAEPASEPEVNNEIAAGVETVCEPVDGVATISEPAGGVATISEVADGRPEPAAPAGESESLSEPVGAVEEPAEPGSVLAEPGEPAGEPEQPVEIEDAFYGPSKLISDIEEPGEPARAVDELADVIEQPAEPTVAIEESASAIEELAGPVDEAGDTGRHVADRAVEMRHDTHAALKEEDVVEDATEDISEDVVEDVADETSREIVEVASEETPKTELSKKFSLPILVGIAVAALVVGLLIGMFLLGGSGGSATTGKTVVSEGELDSPIASYSYQGKNDVVTVREVIEQSTSLEAAKDADGNYQVPSADTALGVVRNKLLVAEAERQGISVTDEDIAEYASANLGTDDYEIIAASYQMDVDAVKALLRESCLMGKLRDVVAPTQDAVMPDPPAQPKSDDEDAMTAPTKEYADYIIALAGDEWDAKKGTWAAEDGPYASGLADAYEITAKGASYEAAMAAYYIAYQLYAQESAETGNQWADYVNGILSNATIEIYTLVA